MQLNIQACRLWPNSSPIWHRSAMASSLDIAVDYYNLRVRPARDIAWSRLHKWDTRSLYWQFEEELIYPVFGRFDLLYSTKPLHPSRLLQSTFIL